MAKLFGLSGVGTGKLGNLVLSVRHGEQIARQYQPIVSNPKSAKQTSARARFKLCTQLAAALSPFIAAPRIANTSRRNRFIKTNYPYSYYLDDAAQIVQADVQFTASAVGFAGFSADRSSGTAIDVALDEDMSQAFDAVMYLVVAKSGEYGMAPKSSLLVSTAGDDGNFPAALPYNGNAISVHAYGIRYNTEAASVAFGNLVSPTSEQVVKLLTSSTLNETDVTMSITRGLYMDEGTNTATTTGSPSVYVAIELYSVTDGTATLSPASGFYPTGTVLNLRASDVQGAFNGWYLNTWTNANMLSGSSEFEYTVTESASILGVVIG